MAMPMAHSMISMLADRHAASEQRRRAVAVVRQEARCDARRRRSALRGWAAVVAYRQSLQVCPAWVHLITAARLPPVMLCHWVPLMYQISC